MKRIFIVVSSLLLLASVAGADWNAGMQAYQKGDYAAALKDFQAATQTNPKYAPAFYMVGKCYEGMGRKSDAIKAYEQASALDPTDPRVAVSLSVLLIDGNRGKEAADALSGIKTDSMNAKQKALIFTLRAQALNAQGQYPAAIDYAKQATQNDGSSYQAWATLGLAYSSQGKPLDAFDAFKRGCDLSGDAITCRNAIANGMTAAQIENNKPREKALYDQVAALATKLAEKRGGPDGSLLAGEALLGARQFDQAMSWFDKSGYDNALVNYYRGQCYAGKGDVRSAESYFKKALTQKPDSDLRRKTYAALGYVLDKLQKYVEAASAYREAGDSQRVAEMEKKQADYEHNKKADEELKKYDELKKLQDQYKALAQGGGASKPTPPPQQP